MADLYISPDTATDAEIAAVDAALLDDQRASVQEHERVVRGGTRRRHELRQLDPRVGQAARGLASRVVLEGGAADHQAVHGHAGIVDLVGLDPPLATATEAARFGRIERGVAVAERSNHGKASNPDPYEEPVGVPTWTSVDAHPVADTSGWTWRAT